MSPGAGGGWSGLRFDAAEVCMVAPEGSAASIGPADQAPTLHPNALSGEGCWAYVFDIITSLWYILLSNG